MNKVLVVAEKFCRLVKEYSKETGKTYDLTTMKLMKLIYIAHGVKLAGIDEPLIADTVEAWANGPVVPKLWRKIDRDYVDGEQIENIKDVTDEDVASINKIDKELIENVFKKYREFSEWDLTKITNCYKSPYSYVYINIDDLLSHVIKNEWTKEYFTLLNKKGK